MFPFPAPLLTVGGGGTPFAHSGALVHITDNSSTTLTASTDISYGNIDYDVQGWRTSATTFTTPTLPVGTLMRLFSSFNGTAANGWEQHKKAGAGFTGNGIGGLASLGGGGSIWSGIIPAVAAEAFTTQWGSSGSTTQLDGRNWMGVEIVAPGTRYTLATLASAQTVVNADGNKAMPWTHSVDTMGAHSNTTNTTRFTVPADTTGKVRLTANMLANASTGAANESNLKVFKNGAIYNCRNQLVINDGSFPMHKAVTHIMDVVAGDYLELPLQITAGTLSFGTGSNNYACFEELPADVRYVLVNLTADLALSNGDNAVAFDGEIHDAEGLHSTSSNKADIVIPSGVTKARCSFAYDVNGGGSVESWITRTRSGSTIKINGGGTGSCLTSSVQNDNCGFGCWIGVQGSDILRLHINANAAGGTLKANALTWFQVEFE